MQAIAAGDVIAGKYRIEREIGRGGMGVVFAAMHVDLDQLVAVKILHEYAAYDQLAISRLLREARAAAKISSSHVVRVMDVGSLSEGGAYIVMELLDGRDLADILREQGPLPVGTAVDYLIEACDAVAAAHSAGIIHRDLKPANLFVAKQADQSASIKVLDFGVSKVVHKPGQSTTTGDLTQTGQIFGSPNYMSPEQLRNATEVDGRTDIWALGVVFYELVSGKLPFGGKSMADVLAAVVRDVPQSLSSVCPDVSSELAAIVDRCLAKDLDERFADVFELATALAPFASPEKQLLAGRIKRAQAPSSGPSSSSGRIEPFPTPPRGVSGDKQHTPNNVSVERAARGSSRNEASSPVAAAKPNRALFAILGVLTIALIGLVAMRGSISDRSADRRIDSSSNSGLPVPSAPVVMPAASMPVVSVPSVSTPEPIASASVASSKVKFDLASKPAKVQVFRGKELLGTTPLSVEFERGRASLMLTFVASGYRSQEVSILPDADRSLVVELAPAGAARPPTKTGTRLPGDLEPF